MENLTENDKIIKLAEQISILSAADRAKIIFLIAQLEGQPDSGHDLVAVLVD